MALAAEYRDDDTHHHTERVGELAALIAHRMGVSDDLVARIRRAAPLHDVGKLAISDTILLKPGKLTAHEYALMQSHAIAGARILSGSSSQILQMAEEIALTHHERWDGTGYPNRLHGEQIPITGRIVALADVFDALTHRRPYKPAWSIAEATAEITNQSARQFDPRIVAAFHELDDRQLQALASNPRPTADELQTNTDAAAA